MVWVSRDAAGAINGLSASQQGNLTEVADDDPEVVQFEAKASAFFNPGPSVLSQDLMAQFTAADATAIQAAIAANVSFWLLWQAMTAQRDPMLTANARFQAGWAALVQVLGADRMTAIATALGVTI